MIVADSSVLVPAIVSDHEAHDLAFAAAQQADASVGHALVETYAVLTRLPAPYTVDPAQAHLGVDSYRGHLLTLAADELVAALEQIASARVVGGAVYDALIALTTVAHGASLLTRDRRAGLLYQRLGADVRWV